MKLIKRGLSLYSPPLSCREVDDLFIGTTFGMEFDCGDFDRHKDLPEGSGTWCTDEVATRSRYGVGADPSLQFNMFGGEMQVAPAETEVELLDRIDNILIAVMPYDHLFWPSTIHVHVRLPKLLKCLDLIRYLVKWCSTHWHLFCDKIYQMEHSEVNGYYRWNSQCNRMVKAMIYDKDALLRMDACTSDDPAEIAGSLHNWPKDWKNEWVDLKSTKQVKRPAVNFGHLALNETIEFRCFQATMNREILANIIAFPLRFLRVALTRDRDPTRILRGLVFQDLFTFVHAGDTEQTVELTRRSNRYFNDQVSTRKAIHAALISKKLTLAELNYPQYWIDKGFN